MQSNSFYFQTPVSSKPVIPQKIPSLLLTKSLKIPLAFQQQPEEQHQRNQLNQLNKLDQLSQPSTDSLPLTLPLVVKEKGKVCRYVWDGKDLDLVSVGGYRGVSGFGLDDWLGKLIIGCRLVIRDFFIPKKVSESYLEYVKWKFLHRVFSSALLVLATQAMFRAIGIGYSQSLPSAAALNWVLKDGLGRLCRCIYTASLASAFDTNLKRVRFSTSVIFSLSIGVELLTPIFPQHFLLLASIANIAKQISLACYLATGSAVHRSFAIADNIGEVSAKSQIQSVCFDNIGLLLAASLNMSLKNNQRLLAALPFVAYPIFTAMDLLGIYQGLKHVHLQTLTKDRLEIILDTWIECGYVPSPAEASKMEGIDIFSTKGAEYWPIRIGTSGSGPRLPKLSMMVMQSVTREDYYFICLESSNGLRRNGGKNILLCLREGAGTTDVIMGLLQACLMRQALHRYSNFCEPALEAGNMSELVSDDWFTLAEDSKRIAQNQVQKVYDRISSAGWAVKNILLNKQEQARYSFVDDRETGLFF